VLGQHKGVSSVIPAPPGINYLDVSLQACERWTYQPPAGHSVGWVAVDEGRLLATDQLEAGDLAVFEPGDGVLAFDAGDGVHVSSSDLPFRTPIPLMLGSHSVHTSREALKRSEREIAGIGKELLAGGKLA
jgi:hypothetical protein